MCPKSAALGTATTILPLNIKHITLVLQLVVVVRLRFLGCLVVMSGTKSIRRTPELPPQSGEVQLRELLFAILIGEEFCHIAMPTVNSPDLWSKGVLDHV